ncbi:hypothetical protein Tco_1571058 [Tanacetum coccineum]
MPVAELQGNSPLAECALNCKKCTGFLPKEDCPVILLCRRLNVSANSLACNLVVHDMMPLSFWFAFTSCDHMVPLVDALMAERPEDLRSFLLFCNCFVAFARSPPWSRAFNDIRAFQKKDFLRLKAAKGKL